MVAQGVREMSEKAMLMLQHMRRQIVGKGTRCVEVHRAAGSIGVEVGGGERDALVDELLWAGHLQRYPAPSLAAHGLYRLTDRGIAAAEEADGSGPLWEVPRDPRQPGS
jgi:hypothetical protein